MMNKYIEDADPSTILMKLNEMREKGLFCDVTITVDGTYFRAHRLVLSTLSPFFEVLLNKHFAESNKESITLHEVDPDIIDAIFDFAYTGRVKISQSNALDLLKAADRFQVLEIKESVRKYILPLIDIPNCLEVFHVASMTHCTDLKQASKSIILSNFSELHKDPSFLELSHEMIIDVISDDDLVVEEEETVFNAVNNWFNRNPEERKTFFVAVVKAVRLFILSPSFLAKVVGHHPLIKNCEELQELIRDVLAFRLDPKMEDVIPPVNHKYRRMIFYHRGLAIGEKKQNSFLADGNQIWCYNPFLQKKEYELPSMFAINKKPGLTMHGGYLYAIGWKTYLFNSNVDFVLVKYDLGIKKWKVVSKVPTTQYPSTFNQCVLVPCNKKLYIRVFDESSFDVYDIETNMWSKSSSMEKTRNESAGICCLGHFIYVIGGGISAVERYNVLANTWEVTFPIPIEELTKVDCYEIAVKDGRIFVKGEKDNFAYVYDSYTHCWSTYVFP